MRRKVYTGEGHFHYVTFSCFRRMKLLDNPEPKKIVIDVLSHLVNEKDLIVVGFAIMPDHVHAILGYIEEKDHSVIMQEWKRWSSRFIRKYLEEINYPHLKELKINTNSGENVKIWERKYYDFNLYSTKKAIEKLNYMHQNPVRAGLVKKAEEYEWSSCRFYERKLEVGVEIRALM